MKEDSECCACCALFFIWGLLFVFGETVNSGQSCEGSDLLLQMERLDQTPASWAVGAGTGDTEAAAGGGAGRARRPGWD